MLTGKQTKGGTLTPSHEHYLRAIAEVRSRLGYARLVDVARELAVTPATLSVGLKPLLTSGLVTHDENKFLLLSSEGEEIARSVNRRFSVLRIFLHDLLGLQTEQAYREACLLEHAMSLTTAERLADLMQMLATDRKLHGRLHEHFARSGDEGHEPCGLVQIAHAEAATKPDEA